MNIGFYQVVKFTSYCVRRFRRATILVISAFMLGMSNVILEEERMLNDTQNKIENKQESDRDSDID